METLSCNGIAADRWGRSHEMRSYPGEKGDRPHGGATAEKAHFVACKGDATAPARLNHNDVASVNTTVPPNRSMVPPCKEEVVPVRKEAHVSAALGHSGGDTAVE